MRTDCDGCGKRITLDSYDDDTLIGGECECGYYTTRYTRQVREDFDWL